MANKNEYKMYKEILEQPKIFKKILLKHIKNGLVIFPELAGKGNELKKLKRAIFLGCGTSFHAAIYGNYVFEEITGLPCEFEMAEEFVLRKTVIEPKTAVIIMSQSGETTDALNAAYKAKGKGAILITLTNKENSTLSKVADISIQMKAGEEKAIAATKTFTSEMILLCLVALFIKQNKKPVTNKIKILIKELGSLSGKMQTILKQENKIKGFANSFVNTKNIYILGEKYSFPIALESALKLKETTYIKAEGMETAEFRHGPIATVNEFTKLIFLAPLDTTFKNTFRVAQEIKKYNGKIFAITNSGNKKLKEITKKQIIIPKTLEMLNPFLMILPIQLLAYHIALQKKLKIDQPRHLNKFVK